MSFGKWWPFSLWPQWVNVILFGDQAPSHYLNQRWNFVNWTLRNKLQWNFKWNSNIFIQENMFECIICGMAAILSQPECSSPGEQQCCIPLIQLAHWDWDKMAAILQTTISNAFSWIKMYWFRFKFHWILLPIVHLKIFQLWFRWWLGDDQATNHYLNQLEQLERLRSEDTPRRLIITHTIESYWIPSEKKTKSKLQI